MGFFNTDFKLFNNRFGNKNELPPMKIKPEPVQREAKQALPLGAYSSRIVTNLGNRLEKEGILEASEITGRDLYPKILTENHDALLQSPQFRGLKVDKQRFAYFLGVNFFCLGVIHRHWEEELGKKSDKFTKADTDQMNRAVKKKKDNYALSFEYLGQKPKSDFGQMLAKLLNDMSDQAVNLSAGKIKSDTSYSRVFSQILFQAGYAVCGEKIVSGDA